MTKICAEKRTAYGRIMKLTGPIILQNLLSAAVTSADVVMLNFVGQEHISAVSLAAQYATVLFMILYGLGTGVTMLSAQYFGKGDLRAVDAVEGIALRFSVAVTAVFAAAAALFCLAVIWNINTGSVHIPVGQIFRIIVLRDATDETAFQIIWTIRGSLRSGRATCAMWRRPIFAGA